MIENKLPEGTLRGQPFIGKDVRYVDRFHGLYDADARVIVTVARECRNCFYRTISEEGDCGHPGDDVYATPPAKRFFGLEENRFLPAQLDGKEVGNYCPHFIDQNLGQGMVKMGGRWLTPLIEYY